MIFNGWSHLRPLCAYAAAMMSCINPALAQQGAFRDPGPPPITAEPVPTIEQAKLFFETNARKYGYIKCPMGSTTSTEVQSTLYLENNTLSEKSTRPVPH